MKRNKETMLNKLPPYICHYCALDLREENGITRAMDHGFTFHEGDCPLCKGKGPLATPADFQLVTSTNENWD